MKVIQFFLLIASCIAIEKQSASLRGKELTQTDNSRVLNRKLNRCDKSPEDYKSSKSYISKSFKGGKSLKSKGAKSSKSAKGKGAKGGRGGKSSKSSKAPGGKGSKSSKAPGGKGRKSSKAPKGKGGKGSKSHKIDCIECFSDEAREEDITEIVRRMSGEVDTLSQYQSQAFRWISEIDTETDACEGDTTIIQRYALAAFYYSTNGDSWSNITGTRWLSTSAGECTWAGITCDESGKITELKLGKLPGKKLSDGLLQI